MRPRLDGSEDLPIEMTETYFHPVGSDASQLTGNPEVTDNFYQILDSAAVQSKKRRRNAQSEGQDPERYGLVEDAILLEEDVNPEEVLDVIRENEETVMERGHQETVSAIQGEKLDLYEDLGLIPDDLSEYCVHLFPKRQDAMLKAVTKHGEQPGGFLELELPERGVIEKKSGDRAEGRVPGEISLDYMTGAYLADTEDNQKVADRFEDLGIEPEIYPEDLSGF